MAGHETADDFVAYLDAVMNRSDPTGIAARPRWVSILGIHYKVEYVETVSRDEPLDGLISPSDRTIRIYRGLPPEESFEVLLHEVVHGVLMRLGRMEEADDETLVQGLAIGLSQALGSISASSPCG
ncbi:hypothetical protein AAK967_00725 [Atopobiaceae bacterium 24-176]